MSDFFSEKTPADVLDYEFNFSNWLISGDTIVNGAATASGAVIDSIDITLTSVIVWVSGGTNNVPAHIDVTATTAVGRVKQVCLTLRIQEC